VAVLLWRRWDWLGFGVVLVCGPQWLIWLNAAPSLGAGVLVLVAFGALGHLAAIGFELRVPETKLRPSSSLLLALNAAVLAVAGHGALADAGHPVAAGAWIGALAAAHLLLALLAGRARVSVDIRLLLATLGVVLGDVAFALLARGPVLAVGFAATGVIFARLVARNRNRPHADALAELGLGGHVAGAVLIALAQSTSLGFLGQGGDEVGATLALAAVAAAAFTSARLTAANQPWRTVLDAVGLAVTAYLTAVNAGGAGLVLAWALEGATLALIARRTQDDVAPIASLLFLSGAAIHALAFEAPPRALALGPPDIGLAAAALAACAGTSTIVARARLIVLGYETAPALNTAAALGLLYLASVAIVGAFQPSASQGAGTLLLDLSVRQEGQMLLSSLWALTGVGTLLLGLRRDGRLLRLGGLALLMITAAKVFLYDLSTLDSGYRIGSFIALGLLLLLGAYAYQRLRPPPPL
jgi:uncharacterized membrane protein